ncbi:MAG: hypothetical protein AB7N76_07265 [Planctomycetota bacterium]
MSGAPPTLEDIQRYVWAKYVSYDAPPFALDEDRALAVLQSHYREHAMASDAECFYYGILAYERSFASPARRKPLLVTALEAFEAYRRQVSSDFAWEAVDDRYREVLGALGLPGGEPSR